jgi:acyl carrier protein
MASETESSETGAASAGAASQVPSRNDILQLVRNSLADILEVSPESIAEPASFADLGADSLALIELVETLEKDLGGQFAGFRVEDEDLEDLRTVRDAVDYVVAKLGSGH